MNDEHLKQLRTMLRNRVSEQYRSMSEEHGEGLDGMLDTLVLSQSLGEAKQARKLLELLPEPEYDVVIEYQTLARAATLDLEDPMEFSAEDPSHAVRRAAYSKREEAVEAVSDRIEVDEIADEEHGRQQWILKDPVTKMRMQYSGRGHENQLEYGKEIFAEDIVDMGVERP